MPFSKPPSGPRAPDPHNMATVIDYSPLGARVGRTPLPQAPRTVGEILQESFELYRSHFAVLFVTAALALGPVYVVKNGLLAMFAMPALGTAAGLESAGKRLEGLQKELAAAHAEGASPSEISRIEQEMAAEAMAAGRQALGAAASAGVALLGLVITLPLTVLATFLAQAALVVVVADRARSGSMSPAGAWRVVRGRLGPLVATSVLAAVLVFAGALMCALPGLVAAFLTMLTVPVVLLEGRSGMDAIKRSVALVRAEWLKALILLIAFVVLGSVARFIGGLFVPDRWFFLDQTVGDLVSLLVLPAPVIGMLLLYQDAARYRGQISDTALIAAEQALVER